MSSRIVVLSFFIRRGGEKRSRVRRYFNVFALWVAFAMKTTTKRGVRGEIQESFKLR